MTRRELRCTRCERLLLTYFVYSGTTRIEVVCPRCRCLNISELAPDEDLTNSVLPSIIVVRA